MLFWYIYGGYRKKEIDQNELFYRWLTRYSSSQSTMHYPYAKVICFILAILQQPYFTRCAILKPEETHTEVLSDQSLLKRHPQVQEPTEADVQSKAPIDPFVIKLDPDEPLINLTFSAYRAPYTPYIEALKFVAEALRSLQNEVDTLWPSSRGYYTHFRCKVC